MRILVTGGAGYVGSHVVRALQEAGHEPVVYDKLSTGHAEAVRGAELVVGDVGDSERLRVTLQGRSFDGCVHLAAASLVGESVQNPSKYFRNNVTSSLVLFDDLVAAGVAWIVLSSTAAVYGEPEAVPIPEIHTKKPTNPYGDSKLMLEHILGWYEGAYGLRHIALRYFNAAGAHPSGEIGEDHTPETHLIPLVLQAALGLRESVKVFGTDYPTPDGTAVRDYIHVSDLASAHISATQRLQRGGASAAYNLGNQKGFSVKEIIDMACVVTERPISVEPASRRHGDPAVLVAASEQARAQLNWEPERDLSAIVESAWRWHAAHPMGYRERVKR